VYVLNTGTASPLSKYTASHTTKPLITTSGVGRGELSGRPGRHSAAGDKIRGTIFEIKNFLSSAVNEVLNTQPNKSEYNK
jgi:hypothetical protein